MLGFGKLNAKYNFSSIVWLNPTGLIGLTIGKGGSDELPHPLTKGSEIGIGGTTVLSVLLCSMPTPTFTHLPKIMKLSDISGIK